MSNYNDNIVEERTGSNALCAHTSIWACICYVGTYRIVDHRRIKLVQMRRLTRRLAVCKYKSKNVDKDLEQTLDHMTFRGRLKDDQKSKISCVGLSTYINHAQIQRGEAGGPDYL